MAKGGTAKRWILRYHGGPTRIIESAKPINEATAKEAYLSRRVWKGTDPLEKDDEWKQCEILLDESLGDHAALLAEHPAVGKSLALIRIGFDVPHGPEIGQPPRKSRVLEKV